jgi:non-ribosomal peptide synthetase component F
MGFLAAFLALLHLYTGREDLVAGTPVLGRDRAETAGLIGFFVNTLALRSDLAGDPSFRSHLGRVRETVLGALDHQDLPFERLVEELRPERHLGRSPLVDAMFLLGRTLAPQFPGLRAERFEIASLGEAKLDLVLEVKAAAERLWAMVEYDAALFDATTVRRLAAHYEALLAAVTADPESPLSRLDLLTPGERQQIGVEWNSSAAGFPLDRCLHELVAEQVERTPEAVAVSCEEGHLTYRELDRRANQLARFLGSLGAKPEVPVAVCGERSLEMLVGLLGVLKSGAYFVPLDPEYPGPGWPSCWRTPARRSFSRSSVSPVRCRPPARGWSCWTRMVRRSPAPARRVPSAGPDRRAWPIPSTPRAPPAGRKRSWRATGGW